MLGILYIPLNFLLTLLSIPLGLLEKLSENDYGGLLLGSTKHESGNYKKLMKSVHNNYGVLTKKGRKGPEELRVHTAKMKNRKKSGCPHEADHIIAASRFGTRSHHGSNVWSDNVENNDIGEVLAIRSEAGDP